jgi:hypothetical protein
MFQKREGKSQARKKLLIKRNFPHVHSLNPAPLAQHRSWHSDDYSRPGLHCKVGPHGKGFQNHPDRIKKGPYHGVCMAGAHALFYRRGCRVACRFGPARAHRENGFFPVRGDAAYTGHLDRLHRRPERIPPVPHRTVCVDNRGDDDICGEPAEVIFDAAAMGRRKLNHSILCGAEKYGLGERSEPPLRFQYCKHL